MGAYADLCKELIEASIKKLPDPVIDYGAGIPIDFEQTELRLLAAMGMPPEFLNGGPGKAYASFGSFRLGGVRTGRFSSSPNLGVKSGDQLIVNGRRRFRVMHVHDEYVEYDPELATLRPIPAENTHPGYHVVCGACPYGLRCMQDKVPAICKHCRVASLPLEPFFAELLLTQAKDVDPKLLLVVNREDLTPYYRTLAKLQPERLHVPVACPLFQESLITCDWCKRLGHKDRPFVTRVLVQEGPHRRRQLSRPFRTPPPLTFRQHLEKHLRRPGDPHRNRYASSQTKQRRSAQRRTRRASSHR